MLQGVVCEVSHKLVRRERHETHKPLVRRLEARLRQEVRGHLLGNRGRVVPLVAHREQQLSSAVFTSSVIAEALDAAIVHKKNFTRGTMPGALVLSGQ